MLNKYHVVYIVIMVRKNKNPTVVHFPHMEHETILNIIIDVHNKKSRRQISKEYDISCYFITKLIKYFNKCTNTEEIKIILDDIYIKNHIIKPIDCHANYIRYKAYYKKYQSERYQKIKNKKLLINDIKCN